MEEHDEDEADGNGHSDPDDVAGALDAVEDGEEAADPDEERGDGSNP